MLIARNATDKSHSINDAAIICAMWGSKLAFDKPSYYAVSKQDIGRYVHLWQSKGANCGVLTEDEALQADWIGIKVASGPDCAAWGRCEIERA